MFQFDSTFIWILTSTLLNLWESFFFALILHLLFWKTYRKKHFKQKFPVKFKTLKFILLTNSWTLLRCLVSCVVSNFAILWYCDIVDCQARRKTMLSRWLLLLNHVKARQEPRIRIESWIGEYEDNKALGGKDQVRKYNCISFMWMMWKVVEVFLELFWKHPSMQFVLLNLHLKDIYRHPSSSNSLL